MKHLCCNILKKGTVLAAALAVFGNSAVFADPVVTDVEDNNLLVSSIFDEDEDIEIKNVKVLRYDANVGYGHMGTFSGAEEKIGMEKGIIMSNTFIEYVFDERAAALSGRTDRPVVFGSGNDSAVESGNFHSDSLINFNAPGDEDDIYRDEDIEKINGNLQSQDVVSVEFDVVPKGKKISFDYVFASEGIKGRAGNPGTDIQERYKYATTMGIWVNAKNTAFVPGTNLPVNSVNIDDTGKYVWAREEDGYFDFGYRVRTPVFNCESAVEPNKSNHVKIAFANTSEGGGASTLFIKGKFSDFSTEPEESGKAAEEEPTVEESPAKEEEPIIENPKTGDVNLCVMAASALASVSGLAVLVKKYKVK